LGCAVTLSWLAFRAIDRLTGALEARNAELARRSTTARGLETVAVEVAAGAELEPTLRAVVSRARSLLRADVAALDANVPGHGRLLITEPASTRTDATAEAVLAEAARGNRLVTPIRLGADGVGDLGVGMREVGAFDVDDVETLTALASMAAVAIRNHGLRSALRDLAVRGERERIAREMHDGLAQVLAYASAKSASAEELLVAGRIDAAREQMAELGRVARSTYIDVRESIVGLTSPVSAEEGLVAALTAYGRQFAETSKLAVDVSASEAARQAVLAPAAEAQAFRVVQEALTNVRKHAAASRVRIALAVDARHLEIVVEDNGRGLPADVGGPDEWPHFGLATMAARAADVGGSVTWTAGRDGGTRVVLRLPTTLPSTPGATPPAPAALGAA
jgi:signal transduction histidine kinase